ncbi:MAG TPA: hypothetical protein VLC71_08255 [Thermomonas sp.]|nr:hypothetical protein [Thermomonas sp.]
MSATRYFISSATVRHLKQRVLQKASSVSSSHLSEALAASLGFNTHAALIAALAGQPTVEAQQPCNARLNARLRQFGYPIRNNAQLLPDLNYSYSMGRRIPRKPRSGVRHAGWRNLMVAAVNEGLAQNLFGLSAGEDWWPGAQPANGGLAGQYRFTFDGSLQAVASVSAIGGDELSIHVLVSPKTSKVEAHSFGGLSDGDAFAHGWLERRLGAWIMEGGEDYTCRRALQARLAGANVQPNGYADDGSFIF